VGDVLLLLPVKVGDEVPVAVQVRVAAAGHGGGKASMAGRRDLGKEKKSSSS
jgi:hypothetical protein